MGDPKSSISHRNSKQSCELKTQNDIVKRVSIGIGIDNISVLVIRDIEDRWLIQSGIGFRYNEYQVIGEYYFGTE